jgi:hypothetical protein
MLYYVDRNGNTFIEKILFNQENSDIGLMQNPFLEKYLKHNPKKPLNESELEQVNKISGYYLSINNKFDLDVRLSLIYIIYI